MNVTAGWTNVDASAHVLARRLPRPILRRLLRHTQAGEDATDVLKSERFVFHNLTRGLPFPSASADAIYSSHFFEHIDRSAAQRLLADCARVLKPGGVVRILVPEQVGEWDGGQPDGDRWLDRHRTMYTFDELRSELERAGFTAQRCAHGHGLCPDVSALDQRPGSLCVEGYLPTQPVLPLPDSLT